MKQEQKEKRNKRLKKRISMCRQRGYIGNLADYIDEYRIHLKLGGVIKFFRLRTTVHKAKTGKSGRAWKQQQLQRRKEKEQK